MRITGREAAKVLAELGLGREQARRVLGAGLLERPVVTAADLDPACREEMFVGRVGPRAAATGLDAIRSGWRLSPYVRLRIRLRVERDGFMPLVATTCGFVVLGRP